MALFAIKQEKEKKKKREGEQLGVLRFMGKISPYGGGEKGEGRKRKKRGGGRGMDKGT